MRPSRALPSALAAGLAALALAAPAQAAFAPALDVSLDPARAGAVPALAARVSQLPGESAVRSFALRLPPGFALNLAWAGTPCDPSASVLRTCPEASRVGTVALVTRLGPAVTGPVHVTPGGGLVAFGTGAAGILDQTLTGAVRPHSRGLEIALDGLPATPLAGFSLRLDGGTRGLFVNPERCGEATVLGLLTSHSDELAAAPDTLHVAGCPDAAEVTGARVRPRRFLAVRRFADRSRRGYGTRLSWRQSSASGPARVRVERRSGSRWRRVGSLLASATAGANVLRFDGRLRDRPLRAGAYRFVIVPHEARSGAAVRFTILAPR